jgi:hypothetical protein
VQQERPDRQARFKIFRGADAPGIEESGVERHRPGAAAAPENMMEAFAGLADPGYSHRVLFAAQGLSLLHLWFKSGFVLPRHSHDTDCLYFVLAGSLRIGTTDLQAGDGFFVGADVPYTYAAGERGVEVLEFRAAEAFYLDLMVKNAAFWSKLVDTMQDKQSVWPAEARPRTAISAD